MSDTYWFALVYLTHYSLAHPLNIGAHRAIQIARHINELCERAMIMLASWFLHRWIRNKNAHKTPNINFQYHNFFLSRNLDTKRKLHIRRINLLFLLVKTRYQTSKSSIHNVL